MEWKWTEFYGEMLPGFVVAAVVFGPVLYWLDEIKAYVQSWL